MYLVDKYNILEIIYNLAEMQIARRDFSYDAHMHCSHDRGYRYGNWHFHIIMLDQEHAYCTVAVDWPTEAVQQLARCVHAWLHQMERKVPSPIVAHCKSGTSRALGDTAIAGYRRY